MKTIQLTLTGAVLLALVGAGCSPDDPEQLSLAITQPEGAAALARYVAIGDNLTAGFMDGGLILDGQLASYPMQIAVQLGYSYDSGSDEWFAQPLIAWPGVGSSALSNPAFAAGVLHWTGSTIAVVDSTPLLDVQDELLLAARYPTPYANLGVPGATTFDVANALGSTTSQVPGNRYFDFILRNPAFGDVAMLGQAIAQGPTLASIWIGYSDVLGGAMSGQPQVGVNVTPPVAYAALLEDVVAGLQDGVLARFGYRPHLVVGDIPSLTAAPYFMPKALFDTVVGGAYPTDEDDVAIVLFPALGLVQGGSTDPLPATLTLTTAEVTVLEETAVAYNDAIADLALVYEFTVAGLNERMGGLSVAERTHFVLLLGQGLTVEQAAATTVYSLDGIHPNNGGYSLVANAFIEAINTELELAGDDAVEPVARRPWDPTYPESIIGSGAASVAR